ncbi:hypothetical protein DZC73_16630 [Albitalea terrae]|uniref:Uncharacterized protein n=1 Tax=Piscinibacter terrae TaxID=2496871 RepID=A0A3N7JRX4_9BURK|nr:hypothetical protein DZC73_16630 [Albitalea terrae]
MLLFQSQGQGAQDIKFDLGKNITETARNSGVPKFQTRNVAGLVSYAVDSIPSQLPVRYVRPGYEITWQPVFALTLYADKDVDASLPVQSVDLQLARHLKTHEAAKAFVEQTIAQFMRGKWHRYHEPEWTTLLTGRSSTLDESGHLANPLRNVDPAYQIPMEDWLVAAPRGIIWQWAGDGVLATLTVADMTGSNGSPAYDVDLEFDVLAVKLKRDADNEAQRRKEGDAKGWNSTARYEADKKAAQVRNRVLEENAVKRGDAVVKAP